MGVLFRERAHTRSNQVVTTPRSKWGSFWKSSLLKASSFLEKEGQAGKFLAER